MQIRVLGCSGSIAAGSRTTAFLLDHDVLIDAGTGVGELTLDELARIDHVLLSHSHLDHVLGVPLLADSVMRKRAGRPPIRVHALAETIAALRAHILNGTIWPDFTRLPSADHPVLEFVPFFCGDTLELVGDDKTRRVEVLSAEHTVPAVGFAVLVDGGGKGEPARAAWVYTGDTGPNPALWQRLRALQGVDRLVIETAFSDEERQLARISRHLHPGALGAELAQLAGPTDVYITHIKPGDVDAVMTQVHALGGRHRVHALASGQVFALDDAPAI
jgi:ribonuclease BN (tRNA processing enzyme)